MRLQIIEEGQGFAGMGASPTVIKVIGAGGGGNNAINRMIDANLKDVQFIAFNTDMQALNSSRAHIRESLGTQTTRGLGAGGNPEIGERAATEDKEKIKKILDGADMVFITAGMGGGTGTGAAPVIASIAREMGILCVACVTRPFDFEGERKKAIAEEGIRKLRENVDSLIVIPNQHLLKLSDRRTSVKQSFQIADDVLRQGVQGISDLITRPGEINIDFADVRSIMQGQGDAIMGIGIGEGENRAVDAATKAINNPLLLDASIEGATGILVNVLCSSDFPLPEYEEIMRIITASADSHAQIKAGIVYDETLGDVVQVSVIATGFRNGHIDTMASRKPGATTYTKESLGELFSTPRPSARDGLVSSMGSSMAGNAGALGHGQTSSLGSVGQALGSGYHAYQPAAGTVHVPGLGTAPASAAASISNPGQEAIKRDGPSSFEDILGGNYSEPTYLRYQRQNQNQNPRK